MHVLSIGSDRSLFDEGSRARIRARAYAEALGTLRIIVFTLRRDNYVPAHEGNLSVYPTCSRTRFGYVFGAVRIAKRLRADVITTQDPFEAGLAGMRAARALNVPLHVQLHTDPFALAFSRASILNRIRLLLMPRVMRRATRIRVVSERLKNALERRYHSSVPITVLPIYTDLARFHAIRHTPEPGHLVWVGRFEKEKDPMLALATLAAARSAGIDARLTMLGTGRLEPALRVRAVQLGIATHVEFPGWADPLPYLAKAELVLATSQYEGYGLSIIEALASGVPVLATDVGGAREAGAIIAPCAGYTKALLDWFKSGPREGRLVAYPYSSFEDYVAAYAADIRAAGAP